MALPEPVDETAPDPVAPPAAAEPEMATAPGWPAAPGALPGGSCVPLCGAPEAPAEGTDRPPLSDAAPGVFAMPLTVVPQPVASASAMTGTHRVVGRMRSPPVLAFRDLALSSATRRRPLPPR